MASQAVAPVPPSRAIRARVLQAATGIGQGEGSQQEDAPGPEGASQKRLPHECGWRVCSGTAHTIL